jgi:hypothetical protein
MAVDWRTRGDPAHRAGDIAAMGRMKTGATRFHPGSTPERNRVGRDGPEGNVAGEGSSGLADFADNLADSRENFRALREFKSLWLRALARTAQGKPACARYP